MTPTKLTAALDAGARGWLVFPLAENRKRPAFGLTDWESRATTDADRIARHWRRHPGDNIGIATGPSGLVVVDLDAAKRDATPIGPEWTDATDGFDVLDRLADRHGPGALPETYTVRTAGGGWHLYYRAPAGAELRNTAGRIGPLIDTRAAGGYVVAAGSVIDRRPYQLLLDVELPTLPDWLTALSAPPCPPPTPLPPTTRSATGYVGAALAAEIDRARTAPAGQRNRCLNKAAWNLAKFVASGQLDRTTVERELQAAGEARLRDPKDTPRDVARTIRSALDNGLRHHPRTVAS
jgi:hypothetical protein